MGFNSELNSWNRCQTIIVPELKGTNSKGDLIFSFLLTGWEGVIFFNTADHYIPFYNMIKKGRIKKEGCLCLRIDDILTQRFVQNWMRNGAALK